MMQFYHEQNYAVQTFDVSAVSVTACESVVSLLPYYQTEDVSEAKVYTQAEVLQRLLALMCVRSYLRDKIICCGWV